jgi:hypothetical protein
LLALVGSCMAKAQRQWAVVSPALLTGLLQGGFSYCAWQNDILLVTGAGLGKGGLSEVSQACEAVCAVLGGECAEGLRLE